VRGARNLRSTQVYSSHARHTETPIESSVTTAITAPAGHVARILGTLAPGGVVLIQESLLEEDRPGPLWTAHFSLMMALDMEGRQLRPSQLRELLVEAGFVDVRVVPLLGYTRTTIAVRPR
jgi:hypothetical protein